MFRFAKDLQVELDRAQYQAERADLREARRAAAEENENDRADVVLRFCRNNRYVGAVTSADEQVLREELEFNVSDPDRFFVDTATLAALEAAGASGALLAILRSSVGSGPGEDIRILSRPTGAA
ncbi:MAG: hypothetical protein Q8K82_15555 [Gemmatimonadaceae bacterium]|nr:hypothetical protein [Gemmatimonadaceae bacterium]